MNDPKQPKVLVIDAQGGGIGKMLVSMIKKELPEVYLTAVGTNSAATTAMLKAGADAAATGENSVLVACRHSDYIIGPIGIVLADSMIGEITPTMAAAVSAAPGKRILLPFQHPDTYLVGVPDFATGKLLNEAVAALKKDLA